LSALLDFFRRQCRRRRASQFRGAMPAATDIAKRARTKRHTGEARQKSPSRAISPSLCQSSFGCFEPGAYMGAFKLDRGRVRLGAAAGPPFPRLTSRGAQIRDLKCLVENVQTCRAHVASLTYCASPRFARIEELAAITSPCDRLRLFVRVRLRAHRAGRWHAH